MCTSSYDTGLLHSGDMSRGGSARRRVSCDRSTTTVKIEFFEMVILEMFGWLRGYRELISR